MKLNIAGLILLSVFMLSCKKDHKVEDPAGEKQSVTFNVSTITKSTGEFENKTVKTMSSMATTALSDKVKTIFYRVYDANGSLVTSQTQYAGSTGFGLIKGNLKPGTYTVVLVAGQSTLSISGSVLSNTIVGFGNSPYFPPLTDTYLKKFSLTVSNTPVSQNLILDHVVANLVVTVEDKIPTGAYYFKISFTDYYRYNVATSTPIPNGTDTYALRQSDNVFTLTNAQKGVANVQFSVITLNTAAPFPVTISCYNSNNTVVYGKTIVNNVICQANKTTILTGKLFGTSTTGNSFAAKIDTAWQPGNNILF